MESKALLQKNHFILDQQAHDLEANWSTFLNFNLQKQQFYCTPYL